MDILAIKSIRNGSLTRENVHKLIKFVQNVDNSEEVSDISPELLSLVTSCILNTNSSNIKLVNKLIKNVRKTKKFVNSINDDFLLVILNTSQNDSNNVKCDSSSNNPLTKLLLDLLNEKYENISFLRLIKFKSIEDELVISEVVRKLKRNNNTVVQILNYIIKFLPLQTYEEILFLLLNYQFNDTIIHIIDQISVRFSKSTFEEKNISEPNSNVVLQYKKILKRLLSSNNNEKLSIMLSHIVYYPYYIDIDAQESDVNSLVLNFKNSSSYEDLIEEHLGVIEHNCNNAVFPKIQENFIKFTTKLYLITGNNKLLDILMKLYNQLNINNTTIVNHIINIFFNPIMPIDIDCDKAYTLNTPNLVGLYNNIQNKSKYKLLMVEVSYLMMSLGLEYQIIVNISDFLNLQYHLLLLLHIYNNELLKINHIFDRENILESFIHHFTHLKAEFNTHYNILLIYNELVNAKNSLVTSVLDNHLSTLSYLNIVSLLYVMLLRKDLINKKLVYKLYDIVIKFNDTELNLLFLFVLLKPYELSLGFLQLKREFPNINNKDYKYIIESLYKSIDSSCIRKFIKVLYENDITVVFFDKELIQDYLEDLYKKFELTVAEDYPYICNVNFKDKLEDQDVDLSVLKNVTKQEIEQIKLNKLKIKLRLKLKLINKVLNIYSLIINNCDKVSFEPLFNQMLNYNKFPILQDFNKVLYKHLFNNLFKNCENKCRSNKEAVDELVQFIMSIYNPNITVPDVVNLITLLYNEVKRDVVEYRNEKMLILSFLLNRTDSKITDEFLYDIILVFLKNKFYYRNYIFQYIIKYYEMVSLNNSDKQNKVDKICNFVELLENVVLDENLIYLFHLYFVIGTESILDIVVKYIKDNGIKPEYLKTSNLPYFKVKLVTFLSLFDLSKLLSSKVEVEVDEIMKIYLYYKCNINVFVLYFKKNYEILNTLKIFKKYIVEYGSLDEVNHLEKLLYNIVLETDVSVLKSDVLVEIISYLINWNNFELIQLVINKITNLGILQNLVKFVDSAKQLGDNQLHITGIVKLILYQKCSDSRYEKLLENVLEKLEHKDNKHLVSTVHNAILNVDKSHKKHWVDGPLNIPHETSVKFMDKFYSLSLSDGSYASIFLLLLEDEFVNKYLNKLVDLIKPDDKDKEFLISTINNLQMPENSLDLSTSSDEVENGLNLLCQVIVKYKTVLNVTALVKVVYNNIKYVYICKFLIKQISEMDELVLELLTNIKNCENEILYYNLLILNHLVEEYDLKSYFHDILLIVNEYIINIDTKLNTLAKGIASNLINFLDSSSIFFNIRSQLYNTFTIPNNTNLVNLINSLTTSLDTNTKHKPLDTLNTGDKRVSEEIDIYLINYILKKSLNMVSVKLKLTTVCKYMVQDITDYSQLDKYYNFILDSLFNLIYDNDQDIFNNLLIIITIFSSKYHLFSERSVTRVVRCQEKISSKTVNTNSNIPSGRREFVNFFKSDEEKTEKLVIDSVQEENLLMSIYDKVMNVKTENMNDVCRKGNVLLNLLMYMSRESKLNIYEDVLKRNELEVLVFILYSCYSVIDLGNLLYNLFTLFQYNKQVDTIKNIITSLILISNNNTRTDFVNTIVYHILYNFYFSKYPGCDQSGLFEVSGTSYEIGLDNLDDQADINDAKGLMILELMNVMITGNMRSYYPNVLLYNVEKKEFYPTPLENKVPENVNGSVAAKEKDDEANKYVKYYLYIYNNAKVKMNNEIIDVMLDNIYYNTMRNKLVIVNFLVKNLKNNQSYTDYVLNDLLSTNLTKEQNSDSVNSHYSIVNISNYIKNREYKLYDQIAVQLDNLDNGDNVGDKDYSSLSGSFDTSELSFQNSASKSYESNTSSESTTNIVIDTSNTNVLVDGLIIGKCMCLYKLMKNDLINRKLVEKVVYFLIFCLNYDNTVKFAMELLNFINFKYKTELSISDNSLDKTVKLTGDENKLVINILNILLMNLKSGECEVVKLSDGTDVVNLQSSDLEVIIYNIVGNESGYFGYVFMKLLKLLTFHKSEEKTLDLLLKLCSLDKSSLLLENVDLLLLFLGLINKMTDVGSIDSLDENDLVNRFLNSIHKKNMYKLVFILFQQILTTTHNTTTKVNGTTHNTKSSVNGVTVNTTIYYIILYKLLNYEIILENFLQEYVQFILHTISSSHNSTSVSFLLNKILNKIINVYKNNEITLIDIIYNHITQVDTSELSTEKTNGEVDESEVNVDLIKVCLNYLNSDNDISIRGVNRAFSILLFISNKGINSFKHCVERVFGIMLRFIVTASVHSDAKNYVDTDRSFETGRTSVTGSDNSVNNCSEDSELNLTSVFSLMSKLLNLNAKYYDKLYRQILTVLLHQLHVNNPVNCTNIVINCIHKLTSQNRDEMINIINNIVTRANINTFLLLFSLLHTIREDEIKMVNKDNLVNYLIGMNKYNLSEKVTKIGNLLVKLNYITNEEFLNLKQQLI